MRSIPTAAYVVVAASAAAALVNAAVFVPALASLGEGISSFSASSTGAIVTVTNTNTSTGQAISASSTYSGATVNSTNSGSGSALEGNTGTVAGGNGILGYGTSTANTSFGVHGKVLGPNSYGFYAESLNSDTAKPSFGLFAYSTSGYAVYAYETVAGLTALYATNTATTNLNSHAIQGNSYGNAIVGTSTAANGIEGVSNGPATGSGSSGGYFQDNSTNGTAAGVTALSTNGYGLYASTTAGIGVKGISTSAQGVVGTSGSSDAGSFHTGVGLSSSGHAGVIATDDSTSGTTNFGGYFSTTNGTGVYSTTGGGNGSPAVRAVSNQGSSYWGTQSGTAVAGLEQDCVTGGFPFLGVNTTTVTNVFKVDCAGNVTITGHITTAGGTLFVTRTPFGARVNTYSQQASMPIIEDFGQGQLLNGEAYVRLAPDFAQTVDPQRRYLVFFTPHGPNHGLYVADESAAGFAVRENPGGRSSLVFDYRIVARPFASRDPRLPLAATAAGPALNRRPVTTRFDRPFRGRPAAAPPVPKPLPAPKILSSQVRH